MTNDKRTVQRYSRFDGSPLDGGEFVLFTDHEEALTAERRRADEWEKKYKDLDRSLMAELRDPSGTIWEYAKSLQDKNDALEARLQEAESTAETIRNYRRKDQETIKELEKEVERLRESLREITRYVTPTGGSYNQWYEQINKIAFKALEDNCNG